MKRYDIKPLTWEHAKDEYREDWFVHTIFCTLNVRRSKYESGKWSSWTFDWCRDEYYDEDSTEVDSAEDGKAKAEAKYMEWLLPALTEIERTRK